MKKLDKALVLLVGLMMLSGCSVEIDGEIEHDHQIPEDISISIDFLVKDALKVLDPFASVGVGIDPFLADDDEVYCNILGDCVTAGDFRKAAIFMLENIELP